MESSYNYASHKIVLYIKYSQWLFPVKYLSFGSLLGLSRILGWIVRSQLHCMPSIQISPVSVSIILPWKRNGPYSYLRSKFPPKPTVLKLYTEAPWELQWIHQSPAGYFKVLENTRLLLVTIQTSSSKLVQSFTLDYTAFLQKVSYLSEAEFLGLVVVKSKCHTINLEQGQGWGCPIRFQGSRSCVVPTFH